MSSGWRLLDRPRRELFETIVGRFRDITQSLGHSPEVFGLIHADLHFGNVIFNGAKLQAIDFDDRGLGYWLYDLAVPLETLEERPDASWLRHALLVGYRRVRALSHDHELLLDGFIAARRVLLLLWLLSRMDHPELRGLFVPYARIALPRLIEFAKQR